MSWGYGWSTGQAIAYNQLKGENARLQDIIVSLVSGRELLQFQKEIIAKLMPVQIKSAYQIEIEEKRNPKECDNNDKE